MNYINSSCALIHLASWFNTNGQFSICHALLLQYYPFNLTRIFTGWLCHYTTNSISRHRPNMLLEPAVLLKYWLRQLSFSAPLDSLSWKWRLSVEWILSSACREAFTTKCICVPLFNFWVLNLMNKICPQHIEAETKWPPFRRRHFPIHFREWNC